MAASIPQRVQSDADRRCSASSTPYLHYSNVRLCICHNKYDSASGSLGQGSPAIRRSETGSQSMRSTIGLGLLHGGQFSAITVILDYRH